MCFWKWQVIWPPGPSASKLNSLRERTGIETWASRRVSWLYQKRDEFPTALIGEYVSAFILKKKSTQENIDTKNCKREPMKYKVKWNVTSLVCQSTTLMLDISIKICFRICSLEVKEIVRQRANAKKSKVKSKEIQSDWRMSVPCEEA